MKNILAAVAKGLTSFSTSHPYLSAAILAAVAYLISFSLGLVAVVTVLWLLNHQ